MRGGPGRPPRRPLTAPSVRGTNARLGRRERHDGGLPRGTPMRSRANTTPMPIVGTPPGVDLNVSSRALLLIAGVLYPAWWFVLAAAGERHATAGILYERLAVGAFCIALWGITFDRRAAGRAA